MTDQDLQQSGSQDGEDAIIASLVPPLPYRGTYVDVGAGHPSECSNTWELYQRGWSGLLIEPNPHFWPLLAQARPRDELVRCACGSELASKPMKMNYSVSSLRENWPIETLSRRMVAVVPLSIILDKHPTVRDNCDVCSIDVEGYERQVILGTDWKTFRPRVLVVEYVWYDPDKPGHDISGEWSDLLVNAGYRLFAKTTFNHIWIPMESEHCSQAD